MTLNQIKIREIKQKDNPQIAKVIRDVLVEFDVPKVGTAYEDITLDCMYETYNKSKSVYFVVEFNGKIIGGAGISKLDNYKGNICELQKMYYLPEARGKGLGNKMMKICLDKAKLFGFKKCYLETLPYMKDARKLYEKNGFDYIDNPIGNTCHYSCDVWMLKDL